MKQNLFSDDAVRLDILRQRSYSMRWASLPEDVIPLSSADPDFPPSQEILDTLHEYLNGGYMPYVPPLGITGLRETLAEGIWKRKHEKTEPEWFIPTDSAARAMQIAAAAVLAPGDEAIIFDPVDLMFGVSIGMAGGKAIYYPCQKHGGHWDFSDLEGYITPKTRMLCLCNPHNPTGRAWTKEELVQVADFCREHDLILFTDEIHGDLMKAGVRHQTALDVTEEMNDRLILASSPTKTFNIPGVIVSYMIIPNEKLRKEIEVTIDRIGMHNPTIFAVTAVEKAYTECDDWYEAVKKYIDANEVFTRDFFAKHFPEFHVYPREGTYLLWIDYQKTGLTEQKLEEWFLKKANVSVYMGSVFGEDGRGCIRLNLASPRKVLDEAYNRMLKVWKEW